MSWRVRVQSWMLLFVVTIDVITVVVVFVDVIVVVIVCRKHFPASYWYRIYSFTGQQTRW